ncbi:expressed protein [Chlorella variabilis]|uniref:Expressed protein n=1 Tax=Chlorella variabilis TaxID=554065 RepID=E1ZG00_CHLVA|nr:expressed protein [Chlorella variabilis]EFN55210.1 expressed protein [Chlorella variabilis]|eukprot:XP_005847312.1 expressed protein [Chlorella variabilis]
MISVVVVHPGDHLGLGTADGEQAAGASTGAPVAGAAASAGGEAPWPVGVIIAADYAAASPPSARSRGVAGGGENPAAEALRAAYLAELEEREAARRELQRLNTAYGPSPSGGWAMSFLPYIM